MITVLDKFDPKEHYFADPYPHIIIEDCLPFDLYQKLFDSFPVDEIKQNLPLLVGHTYRYLANEVINKKTIPVKQEWQNFFDAHTSQEYYQKVLGLLKQILNT